MAAAAKDRDSHVAGVATGFRDLDKLRGGLHQSDLIILAGRPSMGKTALATNIAATAAMARRKEKGPDGVEIEVPEGSNLRQVAMANGIQVYPGITKLLNCLGNGTCGTCRMVLMKGTVENTSPRTFRGKIRFRLSLLNTGADPELPPPSPH